MQTNCPLSTGFAVCIRMEPGNPTQRSARRFLLNPVRGIALAMLGPRRAALENNRVTRFAFLLARLSGARWASPLLAAFQGVATPAVFAGTQPPPAATVVCLLVARYCDVRSVKLRVRALQSHLLSMKLNLVVACFFGRLLSLQEDSEKLSFLDPCCFFPQSSVF